MNAVLKQQIDLLPSIWSVNFDQDKYHSQSSPLLDLNPPAVFPDASTNNLFFPPNPTNYVLPMLNIPPPMTLALPNILGNLPPHGSQLNASLIPSLNVLRIKGMAPGTSVNDILSFLGNYWQAVALHGIHLIYTAAVRNVSCYFISPKSLRRQLSPVWQAAIL